MLSIPPHEVEVRLHNKAPRSALLPPQTESKYRVVLFQIQLSPTLLSLRHQISNFVAMVHLMAGVRRELVDFFPRELREVFKWRMNDLIPFLLAPLTSISPRPLVLSVSL